MGHASFLHSFPAMGESPIIGYRLGLGEGIGSGGTGSERMTSHCTPKDLRLDLFDYKLPNASVRRKANEYTLFYL